MSQITVPRHIQLLCRILHAALDTRPDPSSPPLAALTESSCLLVDVAGMHPRGDRACKRCPAVLSPNGTKNIMTIGRDRPAVARVTPAVPLRPEGQSLRSASRSKCPADSTAKRTTLLVKIRKLEETLETERHARQRVEQAMTDLRVEVATLTERAARTDELRALIEMLQRTGTRGKS